MAIDGDRHELRRVAFHWARRWRVLLRDIFRLGTAMGVLLDGVASKGYMKMNTIMN